MEVLFNLFLTSALERGSGKFHASAALPRYSVSPVNGLDAVAKRKKRNGETVVSICEELRL